MRLPAFQLQVQGDPVALQVADADHIAQQQLVRRSRIDALAVDQRAVFAVQVGDREGAV